MSSPIQASQEIPMPSSEIASQSHVRIVICAFMGGYYSVFGISNHPLFLAFALYSMLLLFIAPKVTAKRSIIPLLTLIIDNSFAIGGLHLTGERGSFLLFFLIHFSFAYGIRYGREYLIGSLIISSAGVTWLFWKSSPWQGHIHFLLSFLFGMPFISLYVYKLTERLRRSEATANANARRTEKLLVFLAHDIRTPLHQLLGSIRRLQASEDSAAWAPTLAKMDSIVNLTARLCSGIVAGQSLSVNHEIAHNFDADDQQRTTLNQRIVEFIELFRDRLDLEGAALRYELSGVIPPGVTMDISAVERVMLNIISNVTRHCRGGYVEVRVDLVAGDESKIRIEIENARDSSLDDQELDSGPNSTERSLFFGTKLGMDSMRDVMSSAGGEFLFQAINKSTFLSTVIFPVSTCPIEYRVKVQLPVIIISRDAALIEKCHAMLSEATNCYLYSSLESFNLNITYYTGEIAAIFVDLNCDSDSADLATIDRFSNRHGVVILLASDLHRLETMRVTRHQIRINRDSARSTWIQALQLSEVFRPAKQLPRAHRDYKLGDLASARILALDDNALNLSFLAAGLRNYGLSIKPVNSLQTAMRDLSDEPFDIFILDWNIGAVTAFELLQEIQNAPLERSPKIILLTAQTVDLHELPPHIVQNTIVLAKPVDNASVLFAIMKLWLRSELTFTNELALSADRIFFLDGYKDLAWDSESSRLIDGLLGEFLMDLDARFADLIVENHVLLHEDAIIKLHAIVSMCYSVGAYALGDKLDIDRNLFLSGSAQGWAISDSGFAQIREILSLTKMHVSMFQLSMRARWAS